MLEYIRGLEMEVAHARRYQAERITKHLNKGGSLNDFTNNSAEWHLDFLLKDCDLVINAYKKDALKKAHSKKKWQFWK